MRIEGLLGECPGVLVTSETGDPMPTDIDIAQSVTPKHIAEIAAKAGVDE